ncbi:MAG: rRNA pseudouridine synthase [Turicibacter sp.]|nr:rRNA pseudouridine synthase [Turicibacter sp.]
MERLQKVIAHAGVASRRKAEQLILDGKVTVNNKIVKELGVKVGVRDKVEVEGIPLQQEKKVYFALHKPRGFISAVADDKNRNTVADFFDRIVPERVYPVGRLDYDTAGVLLMTNDGEFANLMMHPRGEIDKVYLARVKGIANQENLRPLTKGVSIDGYKTKPATVELVSVDKKNNSSLVRLTIHEGRYHQVKKMLDAVNLPVKKLRRERFGTIDVNGLAQGEFRPLTPHEVKTLMATANDPHHVAQRPQDLGKMRRY